MARRSLAQLLVDKGFAPNEYILSLNGSLTAPAQDEAPWNLPSRLFQFPLEVNPIKGPSWAPGKLHIGLMHPLVGEHPFVREVARAIRPFKIKPNGAPNDCGYSKTRTALWWHAVDLVSKGRWQDLLETRRFTTDHDIVRAVVFGLDYSKIRTGDARRMLTVLRVPERHRRDTLRVLDKPIQVKPDKEAAYWPINQRGQADPGVVAWGRVYGIESGWFTASRRGYLQWSPSGVAMHGQKEDRKGQLALPL
jgi:hypothetical protein